MRSWTDYQFMEIQNACVRYNHLLFEPFRWRVRLDNVQDDDVAIKLVFEKIVPSGRVDKKYKFGFDVECQDSHVLDYFRRNKIKLDDEDKFLFERFMDCTQEAFVGTLEVLPEVCQFNKVMAICGYKLEPSPFQEALDFDDYSGAYVDYSKAAVYNLYLPNGDKALNIVINQSTFEWNINGVYNEVAIKTLTNLTESEYLLRGAVEVWTFLGFTRKKSNMKECKSVVNYMTDAVALDRLVVAIARFNTEVKGSSFEIKFRATPSKDKITKGQYPYYAYSIDGFRKGCATGYFGKYGEFVFEESYLSEKQEDRLLFRFKEVYEYVDGLYGFTQKFKLKREKELK